jgi:hypothetical protein
LEFRLAIAISTRFPDADFKRVTVVCDQPNGVGEDSNKTVCYVRAVTVPKKNLPGIRAVTKLLGVAAEGREK